MRFTRIKIFFILFFITSLSLKAQVLDYVSPYGYVDFINNTFVFKSVYKSQEELYKKLKVKSVYLTKERKEYFINRDGRTKKITMKARSFNYYSHPSMYEIELTKQEHHQPLNYERINQVDFTYDAKGRVKSITSSFPYYYDTFRDRERPSRVTFFYHDSLLISMNQKGIDNFTYNDAGLVSSRFFINSEKKDTSRVYFLDDENRRLSLITSKNDTLQYFFYSGDTISISYRKNWRDEYIISDNKLTKYTRFTDNFPVITEEYFYRADGLTDKFLRTYKSKSSPQPDTQEYNYEYDFYED